MCKQMFDVELLVTYKNTWNNLRVRKRISNVEQNN